MIFPPELYKLNNTYVQTYYLAGMAPLRTREAIYVNKKMEAIVVHETKVKEFWQDRQEAIEYLIKSLEETIVYLKRQLD